ncbi:hypothetical protein [Frigoriflavimonas asaccharolytica]|uniref:Uncharacterized protein n=1 Tax=Frigoriflavimonas asaccharolytica TaxID=2735899 RepID=A0A8J8K7J0_9FLAO|nr:hypothetical protein [Frigoriflavimonas asaccharolytica]NRS92058.1 hypothetical protein [Frigoriflavimonas asaccharolytica]
MNTKSIVGLFKKEGNYLQLARELSAQGFVRNDVKVEEDTDDVFFLSVELKNENSLQQAKKVFEVHQPLQMHEFPFVAENANRIREYVASAARARISSAPTIKNHSHGTDGLNAEVIAGI